MGIRNGKDGPRTQLSDQVSTVASPDNHQSSKVKAASVSFTVRTSSNSRGLRSPRHSLIITSARNSRYNYSRQLLTTTLTIPSESKPFRVPPAANLSVCIDPSQAPPRYLSRRPTAEQIPNIQASSCYNPDDRVVITVQDKDKTEEYKIFRGLLTWHSFYFAAALNPESGFCRTVNIRYEISARHDVFKAFYCWLYTGRLMDLTMKRTEARESKDRYLSSGLLGEIWAFADFRGIPALCNAAIDMLHEGSVASWLPVRGSIACAYSNTLEDSKLRAFVVQSSVATESLKSLGEWSA